MLVTVKIGYSALQEDSLDWLSTANTVCWLAEPKSPMSSGQMQECASWDRDLKVCIVYCYWQELLPKGTLEK